MRTVTHMWLERKMEELTKFDVVGYLDIDDLQTLYLDETAKENVFAAICDFMTP